MLPHAKTMIFNHKEKLILAFPFLLFFFALYSYTSLYQTSYPYSLISSSLQTFAVKPRKVDDGNQCRSFDFLMLTYKNCLLENLNEGSKFNGLGPAIRTCLGETLWRALDVHLLRNSDDVKFVILPSSIRKKIDLTGFNCIEVTLGVGKDIEAEKKLRSLVPFCRFYGADPILESGLPFKEMGAYYEVAVAAKPGVMKANVLEKGEYREKSVLTITFMDLIANYTKIDHIDYLFMDNEGAEYGLFDQLKTDGAIEQSNISICQISVEMHGPLASYGMDNAKFDTLITQTIQNSSFLPIWSEPLSSHVRSFYVNVKDEYCLKTFFSGKFC